jgi:hypothetical protein
MSTSTPLLSCHCPATKLHWVIDLLESWLRQASDEVTGELAEFAYGPDPDPGRVEDLIELIGRTAARLRPTMPSCEPREDR